MTLVGKKKAIVDDASRLKGKQEPKPRAKKEVVKLCIKCQATLPLTEFYKNKGWSAQAYHDAWCKNCAKNFSTTKEALREYCFYNNRAWSEGLWDRVKESSRYKLATNQTYLRAEEKKKHQMEEPIACGIYLAQMNLANNYVFSDNVSPEEGHFPEFDSSKQTGSLSESAEEELRIEGDVMYDPEWNGLFTKRDLDYLNNYYAELERDFALDDVSMRDYARKVAKASLLENIMYNKYRAKEVTSREYSDAKSNFDELSKSANFAACRRRAEDKTFVLPLGQVAEYLEIHGKIKDDKERWEKDSIDQMIAEMWHISNSLGLDVGGSSND